MKSLREIRGFGDADDYVLACEAIAINGHDLSMALTVLRQIRSHGSAEDYSEALLIVASYEENLQGTLNWLSRIRGLGTQADYSMALTTTRTHCFAFGEVEDTLKWFRSLGRDPEDYSRTLRFLRSRSYVFSSTKEDLLKIQERSRDANRYSRALRLLEENDFSIQATLNKLGNNPPHQQPYNPPPPFAQPQHPNQLAPPPPFSQQPPRAGSPFRGGFLPMVYGAGAGPSPRSSSNQAPQQQQRPPAFPIPRIGAINAGAIGGDRPRWLRKLFPQDREREEVKRRGRNIEADVQGMCEALGTLDLKGADLVHLGQVLKYTGFDCVKTKSQMLDLASILPDKQDFAWALGFLSRLAGGWPTMQAIFGPDNVDVRFTVTFFRTEHISVDDVLDYLNKDAPKGEDAQRCVLRLWRRQRLSKQGIIGQVNQLRRMVNFNNNVFQAFLYLLEENDFDQDVTRNQWRLLVDAMGGEAHYRCAYRMEVYALPGLKESGGNADDTVHAFCQLQEFSRSGYYSTASETDNHDAALELVRLADFNFQDVIGVLYDYQELAQRQSRVVGGLPVLLKLVRDGNYNIARAHKTIAYLVGPAVELTDEQALRLLERHNYNRDVAVSDHRRNGIVH
ncbi:hypothetical protein FRC17_000986 [Serendipita sp. 399]|nr:hypothetical protein FRC17_000986 [Serendipita sp. 399]